MSVTSVFLIDGHGEILHQITEAAEQPQSHIPLSDNLHHLAMETPKVISGERGHPEELGVRGHRGGGGGGDVVPTARGSVTHVVGDGAISVGQERLMRKSELSGVFVVTRVMTSHLGSPSCSAHNSAPCLHKVGKQVSTEVNKSETNWARSEAMMKQLVIYYYLFQFCIESVVDWIELSFYAHRPSLTEPNFTSKPQGN